MPITDMTYDSVIIGGGFYGVAIAVYLAQQRGFKHIVLVERESTLLTRASYNNQARVHNGYHYPRSFTTAYRSRVNFPKFVHDWPEAITQNFTKLYAIARRNSKVTAKQFVRFCRDIGAKIQAAEPALQALFDPHLIENVFLVEEYAFDATKMSAWAIKELQNCGVHIYLQTSATSLCINANKTFQIALKDKDGAEKVITSRYVFNCTYSRLNQFTRNLPRTVKRLKHEITEMGLLSVPPVLEGLGITVMDGPFFSIMPFPARGLYTLSHVRYTPHMQWDDEECIDPDQKLAQYERVTRIDRMVRDASRYLPAVRDVKYVESLFEIKTVLVQNENDDGRPILFEKYPEFSGYYAVLGGKIDAVYDILLHLDRELLAL